MFWLTGCHRFGVYSAYQKKGNPYSKAHCSKVKRFENLHVAYKWRAAHLLYIREFSIARADRHVTPSLHLCTCNVAGGQLHVHKWSDGVTCPSSRTIENSLLVSFLHQVCHAWPSTLPLKMTMSWPTFCKFWQLDKSAIDKQCNGVAAEMFSSHARWSFPFWKNLNSKVLANSPCALEDLSGVFDMN